MTPSLGDTRVIDLIRELVEGRKSTPNGGGMIGFSMAG